MAVYQQSYGMTDRRKHEFTLSISLNPVTSSSILMEEDEEIINDSKF